MKIQVLVTPASLCSHRELLTELESLANFIFSPQELPLDLSKYNIIILGNEDFGAAQIAKSSNLELIIRYGVTTHNVSLDAAKKNEIIVTNCPKLSDDSVAEYILCSIFYFVKKLHLINKLQPYLLHSFIFEDIKDKILGIIGLGSIGQCLALKARGLGMSVLAYNRTEKTVFCETHGIQFCSIKEVLQNSDFISINVSLNNETRFLLNAHNLSLIKPNAYIINTAQADVVNPEVLYHMLSIGKIAGAALDFIYEHFDFSKFNNVIITPHIASRTRNNTQNKVNLVIATIKQYLAKRVVPEEVLVCGRKVSSSGASHLGNNIT